MSEGSQTVVKVLDPNPCTFLLYIPYFGIEDIIEKVKVELQ